MPLQNRVTPTGELITHPARGLVYGNRGCLHDAHGRIRRRYAVKRWIACRLEFRGWHRGPLLQPGRFTELFFLDEATALAAGHRPCALCRHDDHRALVDLWAEIYPGETGVDAIDARLHSERIDVRTGDRRLHRTHVGDLPDGAFVLHHAEPHLVLGERLLRWTPADYDAAVPRPERGAATVITPPSLVDLLRTDRQPLVPFLHPSVLEVTARSTPGRSTR